MCLYYNYNFEKLCMHRNKGLKEIGRKKESVEAFSEAVKPFELVLFLVGLFRLRVSGICLSFFQFVKTGKTFITEPGT